MIIFHALDSDSPCYPNKIYVRKKEKKKAGNLDSFFAYVPTWLDNNGRLLCTGKAISTESLQKIASVTSDCLTLLLADEIEF